VRAKLTAVDGANLAADAAVGPVNLFLHSMFSQVDISLNGALITSSTNSYPYRSVLETLLSYGEDAKTSQLTSALFYRDQAGVMGSIESGGDVGARNSGLVKHRSIATQSREFDMMDRLHADIFFQDRYILTPPSFLLKKMFPIRNTFLADTYQLMGRMTKYKPTQYARCVVCIPTCIYTQDTKKNA